MKTISRELPGQYSILVNNATYGLTEFVYPGDLALLHRWMHAEHVIQQWQLDISLEKLAARFEVMLADDHQRLYLITLNNRPIGYIEIYEGYRDRLARYYDAEVNDLGWHLLIGELDIVGHGHLRPIGMLINKFIFEYSPASRIVGEPDVRVKPYAKAAKEMSYFPQGELSMPEKTAMLYFCKKEDFINSDVYARYEAESVL